MYEIQSARCERREEERIRGGEEEEGEDEDEGGNANVDVVNIGLDV